MDGNPIDVVRCPVHSFDIMVAARECDGKMAVFWRWQDGMAAPVEMAEAA